MTLAGYVDVPTYIGKLSILEDDKVMLDAKVLKVVNEALIKIFDDIDVSLDF